MRESLNRQLADLHAERVATWAPAALQVVERLLGQQPVRIAI
ncbi:hypothetical protein [Pseudomonas sp. NFX183]